MAHYISYSFFDSHLIWITVVILGLIHAKNRCFSNKHRVFASFQTNKKGFFLKDGGKVLLFPLFQFLFFSWWFIATARIVFGFIADDDSFKFLPYQLWMVVYWTTMVVTGDGEPGFGSGEGAWEMATTSKEGSRDENWPLSKARVSDDT